jgi:hypothetical protein
MKAGRKTGSEEGLPIRRNARKHAAKQRPAAPAPSPVDSIVWLLGLHFFLAVAIFPAVVMLRTLVCSPWLRLSFAFVPYGIVVGLAIGQTALLGIWGSLGTNPWYVRLGCLVAGVAYGGIALGIAIYSLIGGAFLALVVSVLMAVVLLIARFLGLRISAGRIRFSGLARMQFYIRHLMILMFLVACLLSLGQWFKPFLLDVLSDRKFSSMLVRVSVTFAAIGVGSVWAVFGNRHPVLVSIAFVLLSAGIGFWLAQDEVLRLIEFPAAVPTFVESVVLVVSLLVFRAEGYRLAWLPRF